MNANQECREWGELFCSYDDTNYEGLSEGRMLEIFQWMKLDGFSEKQIQKAIDNYEKENGYI